MIKNSFFLLLLFVFAIDDLFGQQRCATEERNNYLHQRGIISHEHEKFDQWILKKLSEKQEQRSGLRQHEEENIYTVPVVVHIIHNGEPLGVGSNIPDHQVFSQIEVLNRDFRRQNADAINTPEMFKPVAADVGFEFVLAQRAPNGSPSNGIVRVYSPKTSWHYITDETELKSLSYWPAEDYINIWVVNNLNGNFIAYSTYPVTDIPGITQPNFDRLKDGIVIGRNYFGSTEHGNFDLDQVYSKGRSLTHEMGHYFGLRHIWGDGGCEADDFCDDTPRSENSYNYCPSGEVSSCGSVDMYQNYMDYTPDRCMNLFTICQKARMRIVMENSPRRVSLLTSPGIVPPAEFDLDLEATNISNPGIVSCETSLIPEIEITNTGRIAVNRFSIGYEIDGLQDIALFANIDIAPGATFIAKLPETLNLPPGQHRIAVEIVEVNGTNDLNQANNQASAYFLVNVQKDVAPIIERFDSGLEWEQISWSVLSMDNPVAWELKRDTNGGRDIHAMVNSFEFENIGAPNWLISPALDFSFANTAGMWFKYSYAYREPYYDVLTIAVSTDCGKTFPFILFQQGGETLSSIRSNEKWVPRTSGDWESQYIDLSMFAGEKDVRVAFVWTNGNGNNIYLDDIELYLYDASQPIVANTNDFQIFPNPGLQDQIKLALRLYERQDIQIVIVDALGRQVHRQMLEDASTQLIQLPLSGLSTGIYVLWVKGSGISKAKRMKIH